MRKKKGVAEKGACSSRELFSNRRGNNRLRNVFFFVILFFGTHHTKPPLAETKRDICSPPPATAAVCMPKARRSRVHSTLKDGANVSLSHPHATLMIVQRGRESGAVALRDMEYSLLEKT